jgi:hypothetical protein
MQNKSKDKHEYDIPTAVTFLFAGLALGSLLTLLFAPVVGPLSAAPEASPVKVQSL